MQSTTLAEILPRTPTPVAFDPPLHAPNMVRNFQDGVTYLIELSDKNAIAVRTTACINLGLEKPNISALGPSTEVADINDITVPELEAATGDNFNTNNPEGCFLRPLNVYTGARLGYNFRPPEESFSGPHMSLPEAIEADLIQLPLVLRPIGESRTGTYPNFITLVREGPLVIAFSAKGTRTAVNDFFGWTFVRHPEEWEVLSTG